MTLSVPPDLGLAPAAFTATFGTPLADVLTPDDVLALLRLDAPAPLTRDEDVRAAVRDALRRHGYKPTGRGKPASEYLVGAAEAGRLGPINAVVDACNAVSLHSGLPISVVDLDRAAPPLAVVVPGPGTRYVFNAGGQEIDVAGLPCLADADGPCANAVRDSQRTKTHDGTRRVLAVVWAPEALAARGETAAAWYGRLLEAAGAAVEPAAVAPIG